METTVLTEYTEKKCLWDIRYCDMCKKPVDMNTAIKARSKRFTNSTLTYSKYYRICDYRSGEGDSGIYCKDCIRAKFEELLSDNLDLNHEITSCDGIVIEEEIREMEAAARREEEAKAERARQEMQETIEQSIREENEMLQQVFGHAGDSGLQ